MLDAASSVVGDTPQPRTTISPLTSAAPLASTNVDSCDPRHLGSHPGVEMMVKPPVPTEAHASSARSPPVRDASVVSGRDAPASQEAQSLNQDQPGENGSPLERPDTRMSVLGDEGYVPSPPPSPSLPPIQRTATIGSCKPYSAFDARTKWVIAALGGVAAVFSPISVSVSQFARA